MNIHPIRLLALGTALLAAFYSEASAAALDVNFGLNGRVAVELGVYGSRANAVIVQPDGKIVAAGSSSSTTADKDFMLFRLLPDGSIDPAFNSDGTVTTAVGSFDDEALTLALQPDGKILAGGYSSNKNRDFALVRYNSDGTLDHSFGAEGIAVTAVGSSHDEITDMIVQEDGSIVIAGVAQGVNGRVVVLGRYLANGTPDLSFAKEGFSLSVVGVDAQAESVALTESGRILVSGSYSDGQRRGLMVLGFDAAGQLDKEFGDNGIAIPPDSSVFSEGYGMFVNKDGGILVAGSVGKENKRDAALFRFTAEGRPDSDLGVLATAVGTQDDVLYDVVVIDETIVAAGFKTVDQQREFLLITYSKDTGAAQENSAQFTTSAVVTTGFSGGKDTSTALAAVSENSVVAVGESKAAAGSSAAAVSKYTTAIAANSSTTANNVLGINTLSDVNTGNQYILTGTPYELTRTTVIIPAEVLNGLSNVTQRGLVFGTMPNPVLTSSASSSSSSSSNSNTSNNAPVMSNLSPSNGDISTAYATLSLSTDVNATCKYDNITPNKDYDQMASTFATTGAKEHSQLVTNLQDGEKKYYVRCKNTASGAVNTTDGIISFAVTITATDPTYSYQLFVDYEKMVNNALKNVGNFFVGTAIAADSTTADATATTSETKFLEEGNTSAGSGSGAFSSKLKNLKPGTFFYARAYAVSGGTTYYGNQVSFRTADSCFIATAAFGSVFDPAVQILRDFRDQFMSGNAVSRSLINFYYQHSPSIADVISQHNTLRFAVRMLLLPVIGVAWIALHIGLSELFFLVIAGFGLILCSQYALRLLRRRSKAVSI
ncbi:MAG: delta-60 repeat domain-containing protein [Candidatus Electronema aureum]|uniref:Delta-60 repeat domain-containing protein n=1 Tax=Candidatus Electronema aureum TaxID=2005002 RepID=A0A521G1V5_9BACT|nr:MAG: delta-60 repeat domain-containing protein [Candidatus Electronema aureum]